MRNALRKAALTLAGLGERDRAWLLGRLHAPEREQVAGLLTELRDMRVQVDAELVRRLALEPAPVERGLAGADATAALRALRDEPDWLVALVLRARAWPWSEEFLRRAGAERRQRIRSAMHAAAELRPKTIARIISALDARVLAHDAEPPPPAKRTWRGVLTWRR